MSIESNYGFTWFPSNIKTLGQAIRYLREAKKLTLRQLAAKVGISTPFLSDLERDRRSTTKLPEFAKALEIDLSILEAMSGRLSSDLKEWVASNPGVVTLSQEIYSRGYDPFMVINLMKKKSSKQHLGESV